MFGENDKKEDVNLQAEIQLSEQLNDKLKFLDASSKELEKEYKEKELKLAYERRSLETSLSMGLSVESGAAAVNPSELQARQLQCLEELSKRNLDLVSLTLPQPEIPTFNGNPLD